MTLTKLSHILFKIDHILLKNNETYCSKLIAVPDTTKSFPGAQELKQNISSKVTKLTFHVMHDIPVIVLAPN